MSNNKKIIILLIFVISLLSFATLFTISRYNYKKTLTGNINSKVIKIEFEPNGNNTYQISQSTTVTVTHKASTSFSVLKYVWSTTEVDASTGTDFTSGDVITKSTDEGQFYLCIYAEDINGLHNNVCSNKFYVDAKAPTMNITTEETATATYIVVEVEDNGSGLKSVVNNEGLTVDHKDGNKYYYIQTNLTTYSFTATDNIDQVTTKSYTACNNLIGNITNFDYTGSVQDYPIACPGKYRLETWGAQGGSSDNDLYGGYGGYSVGISIFNKDDILYIGVGGQGNASANNSSNIYGGYNGGGYSYHWRNNDVKQTSGGGATHIALNNNLGELKNYNNNNSDIIIVSGGGGGSAYGDNQNFIGGSGGGFKGVNGDYKANDNSSYGLGGTQTSGGSYILGTGKWSASEGVFGVGGSSMSAYGGASGGGGYYGGGGAAGHDGAGGGSGYIANASLISKYMSCYNCQTSNEISTMTISNGYHRSNPEPSTAKEGNGYARITYLGDDEYHVILLNSDDFDLHGTSTISGKYYNDLPSIVTPTKAGYTFTGYYDNQTAFDMGYNLANAGTNNIRINFTNIASNGWSMTSADAGTHINAKIIVNKIEIPTIEFNDIKIVPYKVEIDNNKTIIYLDFDITSEMVTSTNYDYEATYRFIDLEFANNTSVSDITIDHITKNGIKYYDEDGESVFPYNKDIRMLYAHKTIINYTIGYTLNGGTVATPNPIAYNAETNTFTLTNPTKEGYDFVGWSGTDLTGNNNTTVTITKESTGNRTYTANWTPTNYTISYELDGGSASNPTSYNIETTSFTLANPTKEGYTFTGWSGTGLSGSANTTVTIAKGSTGNRTYTANWTPTNYTIGYTLNSGSASNPTSYNIETASFTLINPTRTGYTFSGWSGTGLSGSANTTVTIAKGSTGNRTYTANWTPINYTISYTLNGGSASNKTSYNIETTSFTLTNPTRTGYTFTGWSGTGLSGSANTSVTIAKGSTGNRTYTANWTPINYTISYTLNGGSASNKTSYNIETASFTLTNPTRTGYTFTGWSGTGLSGSANKSVTIAKGSTGNRSYTANWSINSYTLTVNPNGGSFNNTTSNSNITKPYGTLYGLTDCPEWGITNPTRTGYTFNGYTLTSGSGKILRGNPSGKSPSVDSPFTQTVKTDSDGSKYTNFKYTNYKPTETTWPSIHYNHYSFTAGHTYRIRFDIRVNTYSNLAYLELRHGCRWNDYSSTGRVTHNITSADVGKGWQRITMDRTWTGTTIAQSNGQTNVAIDPYFAIVTGINANTTSSLDFDIRNIIIEDITSNTQISTLEFAGYIYEYGAGNGTIRVNWK